MLRRSPERLDGAARRLFVPALGLAALCLAVLLYTFDRPAYQAALTVLMMRPYPTPFVDTVQIPALVECWRHGVDVYVTAPCDPLNRTLAYSPLWLRATFLPADLSWLNWLGLAMDGGFFLSLVLLPAPRRWSGALLTAFAALSSLPAFALERGNMDVVMFGMIAVAGRLLVQNGPVRLAGYALITLAGLLKFYPLVLFLLFLRERLTVFAGLCLIALGVLAAFVAGFRGELAEMAQNLPEIGFFKDGFGFRELPGGLGTVLHGLIDGAGLQDQPIFRALDPAHSASLALGTLCVMIAATLGVAARLASRADFRSALASLSPAEHGFLVIGAVLIAGCFLVGENVSYRGIHLMFVVPGLAALAGGSSARRLFRVTLVVVLAVLWGLSLQQLVAALSGGTPTPMAGSIAIYLYWLVHELAWWWVAAVFLAVLFRFVAAAPLWPALARLLPRTA
jgi:hypothetical protein